MYASPDHRRATGVTRSGDSGPAMNARVVRAPRRLCVIAFLSMRVTVIGTGYGGTVTGACLAYLGHRVTCVDVDADKIARRQRGELPIYEPHLSELLGEAALRSGIDFATDVAPGGSEDASTIEMLRELSRLLIEQRFGARPYLPRPSGVTAVPLVATTLTSAEMIKYAANTFLATKIGFANEIANICERVGADAKEVMVGIGLDSRIGSRFLNAGLGWGGSCFGKDIQTLLHTAGEYGYQAPR